MLHPVNVCGDTKVLAVFGYPVEHSLSPAMHNAALAALRLGYIYIPFSVSPDALGSAVQAVRALGIVGVNLTIPHKERVVPYLDEVDPVARAVGAVNTVHNCDGRLVGCNTDGEGFARGLARAGWRADGRAAVVLGAGGAARAVVFRLVADGVPVVIVNRTVARALALADDVCRALPDGSVGCMASADVEAVRAAVADATLLVNATSVGMRPLHAEPAPVPEASLHAGLTVYDLVYSPPETALLAAARRAGATAVNGVAMLANQGAEALRIWTGADPPVDLMEQVVLRCLANREGA